MKLEKGSGEFLKGIYLIRCFGVKYRLIFLRVVCILTSPEGESKYKQARPQTEESTQTLRNAGASTMIKCFDPRALY